MYERGAYFLSDVTNDEGYALPGVRPVDPDILTKLYRRDFWDDMEAEFYVAPIQNKDTNTSHPVYRKASTRKRKTTTRFIEATEGDYEQQQLTGFTEPVESDNDQQPLTERITEFIEPAEINNHRRQRTKTKLRPVGAMESEESEESMGEESGEDKVPPGELNKIIAGIPRLSDILHQFPTDIFQLAPTPRSDEDGQWTLLDPLDKACAKIDIFQSLCVGRFFSQAQCRLMTATEWKEKVFPRYFPHKGVQLGNTRHFPSAAYYMQWIALLDRTEDESVETIRDIVFTWFNGLLWLPNPTSDCMWENKLRAHGEWFMIPRDAPSRKCPHLAINVESSSKEALRALRALDK
jgi:hypothetical protein